MDKASREHVKKRRQNSRVTFIGFLPELYKVVKFNKKEHRDLLTDGRFIKFRYGYSEKKKDQVQMIGKVLKYEKRGVHVITDCGYHCPLWARVDYIYLTKRVRSAK